MEEASSVSLDTVTASATNTITVKRNDTWPPVRFTLEERNEESGEKEPIDLTGALKVLFIMRSETALVTGTCKLTHATAGSGEYVWGLLDTKEDGTYRVEFEIEWTATHFQSVPNEGYLQIIVSEDLGGNAP